MSSPIPWWDDAQAPWDAVELAGFALPGVCNVKGKVGRDIEVKKSKGSDGASIKDNGYKPAPVTVTWRVHTKQQWQELQEFLPTIHPRTQGGERRAVSIKHPAPNLLGVDQIYIRDIVFPEVNGAKEIELRIDALEWREKPKKPKQAAGYGSGGKPGKGNQDDDVEEEKSLIDQAIEDAWSNPYDDCSPSDEKLGKCGEEDPWPFPADDDEPDDDEDYGPPFDADKFLADEYQSNLDDEADWEEYEETT